MLFGLDGLETDRPARTFLADTPLSGRAQSACYNKNPKGGVSRFQSLTHVTRARQEGPPLNEQ